MTERKKENKKEVSAAPTGGASVRDSARSIAKLEMAIEALNSSPKAKTKQAQAELKQLKGILNDTYAEYKRKAMEFEENNSSHLVFVRSTAGFHKLFGRSLLFYAFDVAPKLDLDARIYSDGDFEVKSESGVISVRSLDVVEKALAKLKIRKTKTTDGTGNIVIYKLPWRYSKEQIEKYEGQNTYKLQKFNHVIMTENVMPVLYLNLDDLVKAVYENVRRMEPVARETLGNLMLELAAQLKRIYIEMANGRIKSEESYLAMMARINKMKSQLKIIVDLKLWNARVYARIGDIIIKTQEIIELELKKKSE